MRTTLKELESMTFHLNKITGGLEHRDSKEKGGYYYISQAYGGYALEQTANGGGASQVFGHGQRYTKKALLSLITAAFCFYHEGVVAGAKAAGIDTYPTLNQG